MEERHSWTEAGVDWGSLRTPVAVPDAVRSWTEEAVGGRRGREYGCRNSGSSRERGEGRCCRIVGEGCTSWDSLMVLQTVAAFSRTTEESEGSILTRGRGGRTWRTAGSTMSIMSMAWKSAYES